jgi:hypothetical protein
MTPERPVIPEGDYVSPNLTVVMLDHAFPNKIVGDPRACSWPYLRTSISHNWYVDKHSAGVGFLSRDEAMLLHNLALPFRGLPCLEIGCWRGWSTAHLALATGHLHVVDPVLLKLDVRDGILSSLKNAGVERITLCPGKSPEKVEQISQNQKWSFTFIDGNHNGVAPTVDAEVVHRYAAPDAMIVFHDLTSPDVAGALAWLKVHGWKTHIYNTMQIMGVATRGNVQPIPHTPDPKQDWTLPDHLTPFPIAPTQ